MALTEAERDKIEVEAKKLLDNFSKTLAGIKLKPGKQKEELSGFRKEGEGKGCDIEFRKKMFANAPASEGDFIIAEKKSW